MPLRFERASQDEGTDEAEDKRARDLDDKGHAGEGRSQGIHEAEKPEVHADQESADCGQHEAGADNGRQHASPADERKGENGPCNTLDKEEGADYGNTAVSVGPQVKMDGARERDEYRSNHESEVEDRPLRPRSPGLGDRKIPNLSLVRNGAIVRRN
jgi:hypothetical protein